jgi:hypothetical protein
MMDVQQRKTMVFKDFPAKPGFRWSLLLHNLSGGNIARLSIAQLSLEDYGAKP